jgi:hypothetical protein
MVATSFDPCPDEEINANLKTSIDKSNKYFNDIKTIHLGLAGAIILTMLIGKAILPKNGKHICSIITIVLKLAACLIVVFGISHAQNILKMRNHQCKNKIDELKIRELKILIEACIGSIGVIIGNYLSLGLNNLISFKMDSSMSIIVTMIVCVLLVFSIIGGDALINIFKKEMKIKNECLALDEALSNANVHLGTVGGVFKDFMPNKLEAQPTSKTITKDFNEGFTVMGGKPIIYVHLEGSSHDEGSSYEPNTSPKIKINFQEELAIPKEHSLRITFPKEFNINNATIGKDPAPRSDRSIILHSGDSKEHKYEQYSHIDIHGIKLPSVTGITQPIKLEIVKGDDIVSVSNNNFFDIKDDNTIIIDSSKKMSKIFVRTKGKDLVGENVTLRIRNDDKEDVRLPYFKDKKSINMKKDTGYSNTAGGEIKREDYNHYSIQRVTRKKTEVAAIGSIKIEHKGVQKKVDEAIEACKDDKGIDIDREKWDPEYDTEDKCVKSLEGTYTAAIDAVTKADAYEYIETDTLDGVKLKGGMEILLTGQNEGENGVYKVEEVLEDADTKKKNPGKTKITKIKNKYFNVVQIKEETNNNNGKFFVKESDNSYRDDGKYDVEPNIFEITMDTANMSLEADKFYYFELPLELVDSSKALKIKQFKLQIDTISTEGVFQPDTIKEKVFKGPYTLNGSASLTTTEVMEQQIACPVLSRDLFMKIFLTSVMTGWAVSTIIYLSGDLYEYNASNIEFMIGGGGSTIDTAATAAAAAAAATAATQNV